MDLPVNPGIWPLIFFVREHYAKIMSPDAPVLGYVVHAKPHRVVMVLVRRKVGIPVAECEVFHLLTLYVYGAWRKVQHIEHTVGFADIAEGLVDEPDHCRPAPCLEYHAVISCCAGVVVACKRRIHMDYHCIAIRILAGILDYLYLATAS